MLETEEAGEASSAQETADRPETLREDEQADATVSAGETAEVRASIVVHVCGAVREPGVYTLDAGSRVCQAVEAAGGFSPDADEACVNQAQILTDGTRLRIPTGEETAAAANGGEPGAQDPVIVTAGAAEEGNRTPADGRININTADAETLCRLHGVGESTAAKIIAWRETNGRFRRIEDIMQVSGIKEKLFAKIKDDITV
ncbi:MAG: ComEA family DNA-binding protein [Lachnospiraceae bacterium]|nr:ComEA family DNA-binding protein [Lachnospiraceae bacterium]